MHIPQHEAPLSCYSEHTPEDQKSCKNANSATVKSVPPGLLPTSWKDMEHLFYLQKNKCIALTQLNGSYHQARPRPVYNLSYHQLSRTTLGQNPEDAEAEYIAANVFKYPG